MRAGLAGLTAVLLGLLSSSAPASSHIELIAFDSNRSPWITDHLYTADRNGTHMQLLGVGSHPSLSPNGKLIAFRRGGKVWLMQRDGRGAHSVATSFAVPSLSTPLWSPDNRHLAFGGRPDLTAAAELDVLDLRSGKKRRFPAASFMSWSPDGQRLAYLGFDPFPGALVVAAVDGSRSKTIHTGIEGGSGPAWSPDGKWLAYTRIGRRWQDLYRIHPDGSGDTRLTRDLASQAVVSWSPDGRWLAYLDNDNNGLHTSVRLLDVRGLHIKPRSRTPGSTNGWRSDSKALLMPGGGGLRILDVAAGAVTLVHTRRPAEDITASTWLGTTRLLFSARLHRKDFDLFTIRPDGTSLRRLTSDSADDSQPTWSPNGQRIAFLRGRLPTAICVLTLGRRGRRCFDSGSVIHRPRWSPKGDRIAYECGQTICLLDPESGHVRPLSPLIPPPTGGISWAPDGQRIVYGAAGSLFVVDVDSVQVTRLTTALFAEDSQPAWSPDGTRIVFWSIRNATTYRDPGAYGLYEVDPTVGEASVRKLNLPAYRRPSWSPDGRRLALESGRILIGAETGSIVSPVTRHIVGSRDEFPAWRP